MCKVLGTLTIGADIVTVLWVCREGLEDTDALRLRGQGHSGRHGGRPGDVYLSFMVRLG